MDWGMASPSDRFLQKESVGNGTELEETAREAPILSVRWSLGNRSSVRPNLLSYSVH
jgi:hypothetical protein